MRWEVNKHEGLDAAWGSTHVADWQMLGACSTERI